MSACSPASASSLTLNGQPLCLSPGETLAQLLARQGVDAQRQATAVNGVFVARDQRQAHLLHAGDAVQCFAPIVGG